MMYTLSWQQLLLPSCGNTCCRSVTDCRWKKFKPWAILALISEASMTLKCLMALDLIGSDTLRKHNISCKFAVLQEWVQPMSYNLLLWQWNNCWGYIYVHEDDSVWLMGYRRTWIAWVDQLLTLWQSVWSAVCRLRPIKGLGYSFC